MLLSFSKTPIFLIALVAVFLASFSDVYAGKNSIDGTQETDRSKKRRKIGQSNSEDAEGETSRENVSPLNTKWQPSDGMSIMDLSKGVKGMIMNELGPKDFYAMRRVCKNFNTIADGAFFQNLSLRFKKMLQNGVTKEALWRITKCKEGLIQLSKFFDSYFDKDITQRVVRRNEHKLYIVFGKINDQEKARKFQEHASVWGPYAAAFEILDCYGFSSLELELEHEEKQPEYINNSKVIYPYYTTDSQGKSVWNKGGFEKQQNLLASSFEFFPLLAWNLRLFKIEQDTAIEEATTIEKKMLAHLKLILTKEPRVVCSKELLFAKYLLTITTKNLNSDECTILSDIFEVASNNTMDHKKKADLWSMVASAREIVCKKRGDGTMPSTYDKLGVLYYRAAQYTKDTVKRVGLYLESAEAVKKACDLAADEKEACNYYRNLGRVYLEAAQYPEDIEERVSLCLKSAEAYEKTGEYLKHAEALKMACGLRGEKASATEYYNLAQVYFKAAKSTTDTVKRFSLFLESAEAFKKACDLSDEKISPRYYFNLGCAYFKASESTADTVKRFGLYLKSAEAFKEACDRSGEKITPKYCSNLSHAYFNAALSTKDTVEKAALYFKTAEAVKMALGLLGEKVPANEYCNLGGLYYRAAQYTIDTMKKAYQYLQSAEAYRKACGLSADEKEACKYYRNLGHAYFNAAEYTADIEERVSLYLKSAEAYKKRGEYFMYAEAYKKACGLRGEKASAIEYNKLGSLYFLEAERTVDPEKRVGLYLKSVEVVKMACGLAADEKEACNYYRNLESLYSKAAESTEDITDKANLVLRSAEARKKARDLNG